MIFAAGRGERMRPLTDVTPKPLLTAGGKPLIVWHIENLRQAGIGNILINTAHLGQVLVDYLGNGANLGVKLSYSREEHSPAKVALETAGGIGYALNYFDEQAFIAVSGDIYCDFDYAIAVAAARKLTPQSAWCLLVPNPPHHTDGDFGLIGSHLQLKDSADGKAHQPSYTFSGIGAYHPSFFSALRGRTESAKLAPMLRLAIPEARVSGALHSGVWFDIGTPERLRDLDLLLKDKQ